MVFYKDLTFILSKASLRLFSSCSAFSTSKFAAEIAASEIIFFILWRLWFN